MYLTYFDESGDDGYPTYSSSLFLMTSVCMHESNWKENFIHVYNFRRSIKENFRFPVRLEFHAAEFISDKNPYHGWYDHETRREIIYKFCHMISELKASSVTVAIDKTKVCRPTYEVLKKALTYNVQRIENTLLSSGEHNPKFMIITDEGRLGKMRSTTRAIQRINYIPSHFGAPYRKEISCLIEDPLPKNSDQSYFIQVADIICYITSLYVKSRLCNPPISIAGRAKKVLSDEDVLSLMTALSPVLNTKASKSDQFGVVYYPKK